MVVVWGVFSSLRAFGRLEFSSTVFGCLGEDGWYVDGLEIRPLHRLRRRILPVFYRVSLISQVVNAGFLKHQQYLLDSKMCYYISKRWFAGVLKHQQGQWIWDVTSNKLTNDFGGFDKELGTQKQGGWIVCLLVVVYMLKKLRLRWTWHTTHVVEVICFFATCVVQQQLPRFQPGSTWRDQGFSPRFSLVTVVTLCIRGLLRGWQVMVCEKWFQYWKKSLVFGFTNNQRTSIKELCSRLIVTVIVEIFDDIPSRQWKSWQYSLGCA